MFNNIVRMLITLTFYFLFYGFPSVFADVKLIHRLAMLTLSLLTIINFKINGNPGFDSHQ